jgi:hypothetical protein
MSQVEHPQQPARRRADSACSSDAIAIGNCEGNFIKFTAIRGWQWKECGDDERAQEEQHKNNVSAIGEILHENRLLGFESWACSIVVSH